jgi:outer membrane immunogenic protein
MISWSFIVKKFLSGVVALVLSGAPVWAADMPAVATKAPPSHTAYNWTGCSLGINGGGARSDNEWQGLAATTGPNGLFGGGQAGCDYQTGNLVVGVKGQYDWISASNSAISQTGVGNPSQFDTTFNGFGLAEGRIGYAFDRVLPYVTGGLAAARYRQQVDNVTVTGLVPTFTGSQTVLGVAGGAGFEVALLDNFSFDIEYNYAHLGTTGVPLNCIDPAVCGNLSLSNAIKQNMQIVSFGLNYRFNLAPH